MPLTVRCALHALRFYQAYLSILFSGNCRFEPTCSQYAYGAIERHGAPRGIWLGMKRLLRCHPLSRKFGCDPVPEKRDENGLEMEIYLAANKAGSSAAVSNEVHS